jgi:PilZ domain-containing protein
MSRPAKPTPQRAFQRELIQTEALVVELREPGGRGVSGRSRNLSLNGIFVETEEQVNIGEELQLFVGSPAGAAALRVMARVVHIHPGVGFGAQFLDDNSESREYVAAFIQRVKKKS